MATVTVRTPSDFQFTTTLESHGWLQLAPFAHGDDLSWLSWVQETSGHVLKIRARPVKNGIRAQVDGIPGRLPADVQRAIRASLRRVFNLDLELGGFYRRLADTPRYRWAAGAGAGRLLRSPSVWEDLAKTLFTTNTTWAATRNMARRTVALGPEGPTGGRAFPSPERVASLSRAELAKRINAGYRSDYLYDLAQQIAKGELQVEAWDNSDLSADELYEAVTGVHGFGPYAASVMLKLLGHFDRLTLDTAGRAMFAEKHNRGARAADADIQRHYEPFGRWRGLVMWLDLMH
jgi:3-methyladenine DNA glycosylase/8-oxoguanine DNA glycosylase